MAPTQGFDDDELTMSLSSSQLRRNPSAVGAGTAAPIPIPSRAAQTAVGAAAAAAEIAGTGIKQQQQPPQQDQDSQQAASSASSAPIPQPVVTAGSMSVAATPDSEQGWSRSSSAGNVRTRERIKTGQRIEAYRVLRTLGEGSFGKVKLAVHSRTGQQVALKIIARKRLISRDMAGRVEREIEYLQLLRHPHIIKLYTVIKTETEIIMVLEYAGGELFDYIVQNGRMREPEARRFFQQMICAVEYCHRHKIVHRDLKPENLLLDESLDVKIADFGLSNIMTDGNFLKTSCGSPNYAAPEVIGGKLYAGPEVDVWSCGVILYVLLVGRLPFDDEHIPSLFAKIARGTYSVPAWMPPGAATLIKKMLVVNPLQRATIDDIRADPWFTTELPGYLAPPVEEFFNTGVDPNKSIRKSDIAPNASAKVQERLYNEVTDKISKTMGYGKQDVEEALMAEEPSSIKDVYLLVRENKLTDLIQGSEPLSPEPDSSSPMPSMSSASGRSGGSTLASSLSPRPHVSKIGVLPSSLPSHHKDYTERLRAGGTLEEETDLAPLVLNVDEPAQARTEAEKEETARRLKPHSRSHVRLDEAAKAAPVSAAPAKKAKPVRWQFGIRSRNAPWEALLCIHKALHKLGATYLPDENFDNIHGEERAGPASADGSFLDGGYGGAPLEKEGRRRVDSLDHLVRYKLPADPWHIRVRWGTKALVRSRTLQPSQEALANPNNHHMSQHTDRREPRKDFIALHMDIQIYEMEQGVYLVDFKCSGYETEDRKLLEEKEVSSPFPFLDMAAKLIMQLAEAD